MVIRVGAHLRRRFRRRHNEVQPGISSGNLVHCPQQRLSSYPRCCTMTRRHIIRYAASRPRVNAAPSHRGEAAIRALMPGPKLPPAFHMSPRIRLRSATYPSASSPPIPDTQYRDMAQAVSGTESPSRQCDDRHAHPKRLQSGQSARIRHGIKRDIDLPIGRQHLDMRATGPEVKPVPVDAHSSKPPSHPLTQALARQFLGVQQQAGFVERHQAPAPTASAFHRSASPTC